MSETSHIEALLRRIRPEIRSLSAYQVADAGGRIKLDAMENPFRLPVALRQALASQLAEAELNRYPDPAAVRLTETIRRTLSVPDEAAIVLGNGSDELIQMLAVAVAAPDACLLSFEPGFVMYRMIAEFASLQYVGVPLDEHFRIDMALTRQAIEQHRPALIFIAYPNNPSANLYDEQVIEEIIRLAPGLVILDEAYHPFAQASFLSRLTRYDNLLVMRTVSKLGLAGLRLGLLCGHPALIGEIDKVRLPYNINVLTQVAATFVLDNIDVLDQQAAQIRRQREELLQAMAAMPSLQVFPSQANFILFRVLHGDATAVFERIRDAGVLIKNMKADTGPLAQCLRVTVGSVEENAAFLTALEAALSAT